MRATTAIAAVIFAMSLGGSINRTIAADNPAPAAVNHPATKPTSIFDFGLEPLPKPEEDKITKADAPKPAPPSPTSENPRPAPPKPVKPVDSAQPAKQPSATPNPTAVTDELADVLKACHVDANGVLTCDTAVTLGLKGTEGRHFILTGDMYLAPEPTQYSSGNVTFRLRRVTMKKSIDLNINLMRVKRIMLEGQVVKKFAEPMKFEGLERQKWIPFKIDAGEKAIVVRFGKLEGIAKGPVATEGTNAVNLSPGAKLRNLKLQILDD